MRTRLARLGVASLAAVLLAGGRAWAPATDLRQEVVLSWTYSAEPGGTTVSFNVRCWKSDRVEMPSYDWPIVTNISALPGQGNYSVALPIDTKARSVWFALTAVDANGIESDFAK